MSITVDGRSVSVVHVRHDGRSYGVFAEDLNEFEGTQSEFFNTVENHLDLSVGALSGYELDITDETENAVIRPQAKFGRG
jgi:hypothetical protein